MKTTAAIALFILSCYWGTSDSELQCDFPEDSTTVENYWFTWDITKCRAAKLEDLTDFIIEYKENVCKFDPAKQDENVARLKKILESAKQLLVDLACPLNLQKPVGETVDSLKPLVCAVLKALFKIPGVDVVKKIECGALGILF